MSNEICFGFIGTGNMGGALARAAYLTQSRKTHPALSIYLANRTPEKARNLIDEMDQAGICSVKTNTELAEAAGYIFLGVKPQMTAGLLAEIAPVLAARSDRFVLVSMAAGLTISRIQELAGGNYPVLRIMPNTPASIGEGMILYTCGPGVTADEEAAFLDAMSGAGRFAAIPETQMDAASAVAGCGPAFADLFLEALADGGVACGLPRAQALEFAAQMLAGSARLFLETRRHPGVLKDAVCSPGGSTIQGVRTLEEHGFRAAVINAVIAAYEKNKALG